MAQLTIVADIIVEKDKIDAVKSELIRLIEPTRSEEGCIQYDLHQDNESPEHFLFFEIWENRQLWQNHMQSDHIQHFKASTEGAIASLSVHEMTVVD